MNPARAELARVHDARMRHLFDDGRGYELARIVERTLRERCPSLDGWMLTELRDALALRALESEGRA